MVELYEILRIQYRGLECGFKEPPCCGAKEIFKGEKRASQKRNRAKTLLHLSSLPSCEGQEKPVLLVL
jgi:hypothetical protein